MGLRTLSYVVKLMRHTANLIMQEDVFPKRLIVGVLKSVYKKEDERNMADYRLNKLLKKVSKILANLVLERYSSFLKATTS